MERVRARIKVRVRPPHGTHTTLGPDDPELGVSKLPSWNEVPLGPFKGVEDPHSRRVCRFVCSTSALCRFAFIFAGSKAASGRTHILLCYSSWWGNFVFALTNRSFFQTV